MTEQCRDVHNEQIRNFLKSPNTLGRISDRREQLWFVQCSKSKNESLVNFTLQFEVTDLGV